MSNRLVFCFIALVVVAACSGSSVTPLSPPASVPATVAPASEPPSAAVATPTSSPAASTRITFTSPLYSYSITLPAGWSVAPAMLPWDGASAPGNDEPYVDRFVSPATVSVFGFAGPVTTDMDHFVKDNIAWVVRDHGDTCPTTAPETTGPIQVGGKEGKLLSWNCGILINQALLISDGTGLVFVMRDPGVHAATDAIDRALLGDLMDSVTLPT